MFLISTSAKRKKYDIQHGIETTGTATENVSLGGGNGKVYDLIIPIAALVIFCVGAMLYRGGILEGNSIKTIY